METKVVLVAFNGEAMCFVHVLLNALDMQDKGYNVKIVIEGSATKLVKDLNDSSTPFAPLYAQVKEQGLIDCVCMACAAKMNVLDAVKEQKLTLSQNMKGHPSIAEYMEQGYQVITF
jgi:hypothetical protein